jgi:hypothetical protein
MWPTLSECRTRLLTPHGDCSQPLYFPRSDAYCGKWVPNSNTRSVFKNIQIKHLQHMCENRWNTWNMHLKHFKHASETLVKTPKNTWEAIEKHVQYLNKTLAINTLITYVWKHTKHLEYTLATYVYNHCNIWNILIYFCNIHINTCNIPIKHLKYSKHTLATLAFKHKISLLLGRMETRCRAGRTYQKHVRGGTSGGDVPSDIHAGESVQEMETSKVDMEVAWLAGVGLTMITVLWPWRAKKGVVGDFEMILHSAKGMLQIRRVIDEQVHAITQISVE